MIEVENGKEKEDKELRELIVAVSELEREVALRIKKAKEDAERIVKEAEALAQEILKKAETEPITVETPAEISQSQISASEKLSPANKDEMVDFGLKVIIFGQGRE